MKTDQNAVADLVSLGPYLSPPEISLRSDKNCRSSSKITFDNVMANQPN